MEEVRRQKDGGSDEFQISDLVSTDEVADQTGYSNTTTKLQKPRHRRPFIKGPIDLEWMQEASRARAVELAIYLQYKAGILGVNAKIQIRPAECREFGLADKARQRQIDRLEQAGLIVADRGVGRCPIVTLRTQLARGR